MPVAKSLGDGSIPLAFKKPAAWNPSEEAVYEEVDREPEDQKKHELVRGHLAAPNRRTGFSFANVPP